MTGCIYHEADLDGVMSKAKDVSERRLVSLRGNIFSMISKPLTW